MFLRKKVSILAFINIADLSGGNKTGYRGGKIDSTLRLTPISNPCMRIHASDYAYIYALRTG